MRPRCGWQAGTSCRSKRSDRPDRIPNSAPSPTGQKAETASAWPLPFFAVCTWRRCGVGKRAGITLSKAGGADAKYLRRRAIAAADAVEALCLGQPNARGKHAQADAQLL